MNCLLLFEADRVPGSIDRFSVRDARARHVREVLRAIVGKSLRVGLLEGPLGTGTIVAIDDAAIEIECAFEPEPPPRPRTDLIVAVPRPKTLAKLLPAVTALGVDRIVLLRTWRVEKPYLSSDALTLERIVPLLREGLMQAGCTREPRVTVEPLFRPFVEDRLAREFAGGLAIVAHPTATRRLAEMSVGPRDRATIVIGPEGGLLPYEIDLLAGAGFVPVRMGAHVLRVETACVAALAQVDLLRGLEETCPVQECRGAAE